MFSNGREDRVGFGAFALHIGGYKEFEGVLPFAPHRVSGVLGEIQGVAECEAIQRPESDRGGEEDRGAEGRG